jgi:hypothetical protein
MGLRLIDLHRSGQLHARDVTHDALISAAASGDVRLQALNEVAEGKCLDGGI